jgi:hypothetical protein
MVVLPKLLVFCGIPGSGKTTIANLVAASLEDTAHIQTDMVRTMVSKPRYTNEESEFVYSACVAIAGEALSRGYNAILDGTFLREGFRRDALKRLRGAYDSYLIVYVSCDTTTAYQRNTARRANVPQIRFNQMLSRIEEPANALRIDSNRMPAEQAAKAVLHQIGINE